MYKQTIIAIFFLIATAGKAQDRLIRVDSTSVAWWKNYPQIVFFDKEKARMLIPQDAAFGVECMPSFSPEWALTYDSIAHSLIYREAEASIWSTTYMVWYKSKKIWGKRHHSKWVQRKHPKDYEAPAVKTFTLAITPEQTAMLQAIWQNACGTAVEREVLMLDGTKWEFFIDGKRAKSYRKENLFVKFTNELKEVVRNGDTSSSDSLINAEFQRVVSGLTNVNFIEKPQQNNNDSIIVITNGKQLPDSLCRQINHRPKQFYHKQGELIDSMTIWTAIGAKTYFGIECPILELKTVPDTLNDAYISQHPEMRQTLRHVSGIVLDENDNPLADAWVGLYGEGAGALTDCFGHFSFWLPREEKRRKKKFLYVECPGYQNLRNINIIEYPLRINLRN